MRRPVSDRVRQFAKALRTNQTDAEWHLWAHLRGGRLGGLKFKRQVPMDGYIVDFVCLDSKLIVELDGGQHAESVRDRLRDEHFSKAGFETMPFWNSDVLEDVEDVAHQIELAAKSRSPHRGLTMPPRLLPPGGGG